MKLKGEIFFEVQHQSTPKKDKNTSWWHDFQHHLFVGMSLRGGSGCAQAPRRKSSTSCLRWKKAEAEDSGITHVTETPFCIVSSLMFIDSQESTSPYCTWKECIPFKQNDPIKKTHVLGRCKGCYAHLLTDGDPNFFSIKFFGVWW